MDAVLHDLRRRHRSQNEHEYPEWMCRRCRAISDLFLEPYITKSSLWDARRNAAPFIIDEDDPRCRDVTRGPVALIEETHEELMVSECKLCRLLGSIVHPSLSHRPLQIREFSANDTYALLHPEVLFRTRLLDTSVIGVTVDEHTQPVDFIGCRSSLSRDAIVKPRKVNRATGLMRGSYNNGDYYQDDALSYVWGAAASTEISSSQSSQLPANLPRVIEDSLLAVKNLGYRYLWVDRYCITQSNEEEKHSLINAMHLVYGNAEITIIAAAGAGPAHGLPGVGSRPRELQAFLTVGKNTFIRTFPHASQTLKDSTWSTRGWTFQEGILSKRRLIFTDQQVAFQCNGMHCSETVDWPYKLMQEGPENAFAPTVPEPPFELSIPRAYPSGWGEDYYPLLGYIEDFTRRTLSYPEDRMRAFLGVLGVFTTRKQPIFHVWGVPVLLSAHRVDISLNWLHKAPCRRREEFPSWSWTGWDGPLQPGTHGRLLGYNLFQVSLESPSSDGRNISLEEFYKQHSAFASYSLGSRYLLLSVQLIPVASFRQVDQPNLTRRRYLEGDLFARFTRPDGNPVLFPLCADVDLSFVNSSMQFMMFPTETAGGERFAMVIKQVDSYYEREGLIIYSVLSVLYEYPDGTVGQSSGDRMYTTENDLDRMFSSAGFTDIRLG
ncbi:HET-domain-containing protein [Apiospora marii]|uniref:HET-domain-containing protein n=1 Tax=Apiospora marii TaxID=335849 RepID=UPI00312E88FC